MDKTNLPVKLPAPIVIYDSKGNVVSFTRKRSVDRMVRIKHAPPTIKSPVLGYRNYWSRDTFQTGEYDLAEISRAADTDSYLARAFKKKTGLLMKEGYRWVGQNQNTIKYLKKRISQIERATSMPFKLLLREVAGDLIKFSNAYIVKVRDKKASGGAVRKIPGKTIKPVAGYFRVPPETMFFKRDQQGHVIKYQQKILRPMVSPKSGKWPEWNPEDVIHIYHDKKGGFAVGTPDSVPVLDDVRVLRRMEEDVELLVYQHLFPLYHYTVGTETAPAQIFADGATEVDLIRAQVEDMPAEGSIVTPERHEIKAIGAQGKALKADPFLEHFKKRVWAGLSMSAIDYGEGSSANRNTADALSQALIDCVKDFQQIMELFVDFFIIGELLLESTFSIDVLDDEHSVHLQFNEIDLEAKIKRDANAVNLYQGHVIGLTKARKEVGEEPITADEESEMYWDRIEKPRLIIQSIDEPYTAESKAAMSGKSNPSSPSNPAVTSKKVATKTKAPTEGKSRGGKAAAAKTQPTNQHGTNPGPTKRKSSQESRFMQLFDAFKEAVFLLLFRDLVETIQLHDHGWRKQMGRFVDEIITQKYLEFTRGYFYRGLRDVQASKHATHPVARVRIKELQSYASQRISWLTDRVLDTIESLALQGYDKKYINSALDSFAFRANFLDRTVKRQAQTYGQAIGLLLDGYEYAYIFRTPKEEDVECVECDKFHNKRISLEYLSITDLPPWHDNCECQLSLYPEPEYLIDMFSDAKKKKKKKTYDQTMHVHQMPTLDDSRTEPADDLPNHTHEYNDGKETGPPIDGDDGHVHALEEGPETGPPEKVEDAIADLTAKEERCVISVKRDLIKRHPTWSEGRIKSSAIAICRAKFEPGTRQRKKDVSTGEKMNKRCLAAAKAEIRNKNPKFSASKVNALAQEVCKMHALDPSPGTLVK